MTILAGTAGLKSPAVVESADGWTGLLTSGLAGAAAAIVLTLYLRGQYRSPRDIARHTAAAAVAFGLLVFAAYDLSHAAFDYLGINSAKPAVEFEIRLPNAAALAVTAGTTQIELHTDKNQTLARLREGLASTEDGRTVSCGSRRTRAIPINSGRGIWPIALHRQLQPSPSASRRMTPSRSATACSDARQTQGFHDQGIWPSSFITKPFSLDLDSLSNAVSYRLNADRNAMPPAIVRTLIACVMESRESFDA
jgi:hypothetical protein